MEAQHSAQSGARAKTPPELTLRRLRPAAPTGIWGSHFWNSECQLCSTTCVPHNSAAGSVLAKFKCRWSKYPSSLPLIT